MSLSDRAFIKAYSLDPAEPTPPAHHMSAGSSFAGAPGPSVEQLYAPASHPSIDVTPVPVPIPEQNVTHFVPEPHFVVASHTQAQETARQQTARQPLYSPNTPTPVSTPAPTPMPSLPSAQPLSSFVVPPVVQEIFEPALEVQSFLWPTESDELLHRHPDQWDQLARDLTGSRVQSSNILVITGLARGEGRTTTMFCLARALARQGAKTVMVDADFQSPTLATQLSLGVESGWEDAIGGSIPLSEAMILSQEEHLALLPLVGADPNLAQMAGNMQVAVHLQMLAEKYHTVLVDLGPVDSPESPALRLLHGIGSAGAVLVSDRRGLVSDRRGLVSDQRTADPDRVAEVAQRITLSGVTVLGMIDNFASVHSPKPQFEPVSNVETSPSVNLSGSSPTTH